MPVPSSFPVARTAAAPAISVTWFSKIAFAPTLKEPLKSFAPAAPMIGFPSVKMPPRPAPCVMPGPTRLIVPAPVSLPFTVMFPTFVPGTK